jgi:isopentenyl-diphosphate Delta-isomerase
MQRPQSKEEILVLVDDNDREIGTDTRENCHLGKGRRHRAYVVFLFHGGKLILQQRSRLKKLWPGSWDVSFTSHVYPGESYEQAAKRKGIQELGATFGPLKDAYSFVYFAPQGKYAENEFCKLLVADFDGKVKPNQDEIMAVRWTTVKELGAELKKNPDAYTPWLKLAFEGFLGSPAAKNYS